MPDAEEEFLGLIGDLLRAGQRAGTVRRDVDVPDVKAISADPWRCSRETGCGRAADRGRIGRLAREVIGRAGHRALTGRRPIVAFYEPGDCAAYLVDGADQLVLGQRCRGRRRGRSSRVRLGLAARRRDRAATRVVVRHWPCTDGFRDDEHGRRLRSRAVLGARAASSASAVRRAVLPRNGQARHRHRSRARTESPGGPVVGEQVIATDAASGDNVIGDARDSVAAVPDTLVYRCATALFGGVSDQRAAGGGRLRVLLRAPAGRSVPHRYSQLLSLAISIAESLGDGVLGIVLWLGPLIAAGYYMHIDRRWGPSMRVDQSIGAGVLWLVGDVLGVGFIAVLMHQFSSDERSTAKIVDAALDQSASEDSAGSSGLWWESDPQLRERMRRR